MPALLNITGTHVQLSLAEYVSVQYEIVTFYNRNKLTYIRALGLSCQMIVNVRRKHIKIKRIDTRLELLCDHLQLAVNSLAHLQRPITAVSAHYQNMVLEQVFRVATFQST